MAPASTPLPSGLLEAIEVECLRQQVDEARRGYLLEGWRYARGLALANSPLTKEILLEMARLVEPTSRGRFRTVPVVFANGNTAVHPQGVERGVERLLNFWPELTSPGELKLYWLREFLEVHPFTDGNGRVTWLLQQWLFSLWEKPEPLPAFQF